MKNNGFTLIEILVVIGVMVIILAVSTINLVSLRNKTSVNSSIIQFVADLKQQQTKAMIADTEGRVSTDLYGIELLAHSYVLFHGTTYSVASTDNFTVNMESTLSLSPINQAVIFKKGNGELQTGSPTSITITNTVSGDPPKTIIINSFGTVISVN